MEECAHCNQAMCTNAMHAQSNHLLSMTSTRPKEFVVSSKATSINILIQLKVYDSILLDSSIEMEFLVSDESPYFSHYACKILLAIDVACKSYKRKRSESSVTTKFTTFESMDRFNVNFDISN